MKHFIFQLSLRRAILSLGLTLLIPSFTLAEEEVSFTKQIEPILAQHCYKCHGEEKAAADIRFDTIEDIEDSETVTSGDVDDSLLYLSLVLPKDHKERMPKKAEPLSAHEVDLVRRWIQGGAKMEAGAENKTPSRNEPKVPVIEPASQKAVASLISAGAVVIPFAENDFRLSVTFTKASLQKPSEQLALLLGVAKQLHRLNLAGTTVQDSDLAILEKLPNITHLHLEKTSTGDSGLKYVATLKQLQYLNLYETKVTDAGLKTLKPSVSLRKLYLWQTAVSYKASQELEKAIPGLHINLGANHPEVVRLKLTKKQSQVKTRISAAAHSLKKAQEEQVAAAKEAADIEAAMKKLPKADEK